MKKNLKIVFFSCLIGASLACIFFLNIKEKAEAKNRPILYAFQVGVFKNEQNAINLKNNYFHAKIIKDKEYYRVFIAVTATNKENLEATFADAEINYYLKEIEVSESIYNEILKYDTLLEKSSKESRDSILNKMLESIPNEL